MWLGAQLLEQDRNLWRQRDLERRQSTADAVARAMDQSLSEMEHWQKDQPIPEGALGIIIAQSELRTEPAGRAVWLPFPPSLPPAGSREFTTLEAIEFQGSSEKALIRYQELARSPKPAVQAGALLRIARVYRNSGHPDEALIVYRKLAEIPRIAIENMPADLEARRAACALLEESGRKAELAREAASLEADFLAGRWVLDQAAWELNAAQIASWTGHAVSVPAERQALSEAAGWLWEQSRGLETSGRRILDAAGTPITILWRTEASETTAVAIAPSLLWTWAESAIENLRTTDHISLIADSGQVLTGEKPTPGAAVVRRTAAESGLPWTLVLRPGSASHESQDFAARRRLLSLGLGAIVLLLAGGSYLLWRVVQRELAIARLQTDFVSAVSHEFRTPLTSLLHVTELLEEDDNVPVERRKKFYAALGRSTERLHRLVESLLDFGRMELDRKPYDLRPVDAGAIAKQVVDDFQREASAHGYNIRLELDEAGTLPLRADAAALTHALWNLLDNAIKYSPKEGEVSVSVHGCADGVAIAVEDHGLGIPRHERKEIFGKFIRGGKAKELGIKGTGLGLAMVSHIVRAHGGRVELESEEGSGSTFRLVLPSRT
jgi:signal transduction histidine kinase